MRAASAIAFGNELDGEPAESFGAPLLVPTMKTPCDLPVLFPQNQQG